MKNLWDFEWYRKLCGDEDVHTANIDFDQEFIDGQLYAGPEIADCYSKKLKTMTPPKQAEYIAEIRDFQTSSVSAFEAETKQKCPGNIVYKREKHIADAVKTDFLVASESFISVFRIDRYFIKGKHIVRCDHFDNDDAFKFLGLMNGAFESYHEYY